MQANTNSHGLTLVIGGTGKTGRRVAEKLEALGHATRAVSRSTDPGFDWGEPATWGPALEGATAAYITYAPDLAVPGATEAVQAFVDQAVERGVKRLVLLSGRGEEEAQRAEKIIQRDDVEWTVVRSSWFAQNFSEGPFLEMVLSGQITLPAGDVAEPFIDAEDIADVVVAALTEEGHNGEVYEVTGPRLLTFMDAAHEMGRAAGRSIRFEQIPGEVFASGMAQAGAPKEVIWLLGYLFGTVLDGRNAWVANGVERALGRRPRDFSDYAERTAETGIWNRGAAA